MICIGTCCMPDRHSVTTSTDTVSAVEGAELSPQGRGPAARECYPRRWQGDWRCFIDRALARESKHSASKQATVELTPCRNHFIHEERGSSTLSYRHIGRALPQTCIDKR